MARLAWTVVNADTSILKLASDVNYLQWLRQYFRAANRRRNRLNPQEIADRATLTLASVVQLPKTLSAMSIAQQEILRRQARVFQASTSKTGWFLAMLCSFLASGLLLCGGLVICTILGQVCEVPLEPVLGPQLTAVVSALPSLGFWPWVGVLVLVLLFYWRVMVVRRSYLQRDMVPPPEARPAI